MTAPVVGVLLPVRLETRFLPPRVGFDTWKLRVRVVPDAVIITNHNHTPTDVELDAITNLWRTVAGSPLDSAIGLRALRQLASEVGFERTSWLIRTFPPIQDANGSISVVRPEVIRDGPRESRVTGLPPQIELWIARRGGPPRRAAKLGVKVDNVPMDFADPTTPDETWWSSFDVAVDVGLAAEIDLGTDPSDIDALFAVGIGGGDPGPLFSDHADTGRLGISPTGSPTTSLDGRPAASIGDDVTELAELLADRTGPPAAGTQAVAESLGPTTLLPPLTGGRTAHRGLNSALVQALGRRSGGMGWPAFSGTADARTPWASGPPTTSCRKVRCPRCGSVRVSYGLLPATSLLVAW